MAVNTLHPGWEVVDYFDLQPPPGAFVSTSWETYDIHGESIRALNWLHAEFVWVWSLFDRAGREHNRCEHCNQAIRYAVIFADQEGGHHVIGQQCAGFVASGQERDAYEERKRLASIRQVNTQRGPRAVLDLGEAEAWFWNVPREQRLPAISMKKSTVRERDRHGRIVGERQAWFLALWGTDTDDVLRGYQACRATKEQRPRTATAHRVGT